MKRWKLGLLGLVGAASLWAFSGPVPSVGAESPPERTPGVTLPALKQASSWASLIAETAPPKRKKARNGEGEDLKRSYAELLKKPETLGFTPHDGLYRNIYSIARTYFVEEVRDAQLTAGLTKELTNFLTQAKVDTAPLKELEKVRPVEAFSKVQELYKGKVDSSLLGFATLNGLLDGLKDNYSVLLTPEEWRKMSEQLNSVSFGGIGIYIELDRENGNQLTVFEPIEGTPAYNAGLLSGDKIKKIDGKSTAGVTLDVAQTWIRGPKGTQVVMTIERDGQTQDIPVTRDTIQTVSVSSRMFPGQVGYVRVRSFASDTGQELQSHLGKLKNQGAKSLIMDLRNNGGGYIDASVEVVGEFSPSKTLVVYTIDRNGRKKEYRSHNEGAYKLPMVVMINEFSASASEITAGAMRDHKLATLLGDHSFGKGSVQQLYPLDLAQGESPRLKLTVARFYTPGGSVIDRKGIEPQVVVDMEPRWVGKVEKDTQLKKALELLGGSPK